MPKLKKYKSIDLTKTPEVLRRQSILRPRTVEKYIHVVEKFLNTSRAFKRAHPMSKRVALPFRYDWADTKKHTVVLHQSPGRTAVLMQQKGSELAVSGNVFVTPKRTGPYQRVGNQVVVHTPGGHTDTMDIVEQAKPSNNQRKLNYDHAVEKHEVTTLLSYKNQHSPVKGERINNRSVHDGQSADEKAAEAMKEFYGNLVSENMITHHEYTHAIAGHWGVVKEEGTGKKLDPAAASSTFVAPAAFNTEMILFERFADFLVFLNHHRNKVAASKPSVEYTMRYEQDPTTYAIFSAEITIKDIPTGIEFKHHWDNPSKIVAKPSAAIFQQWLAFLKMAHGRQLKEELEPVPKSPLFHSPPPLMSKAGALDGMLLFSQSGDFSASDNTKTLLPTKKSHKAHY